MQLGEVNIVFDICGTEEQTPLQFLSPFLPKRGGKMCLDVLCISHGDKDHCGGFSELKTEIDKGNLLIGEIWHPNYDRTRVDDVQDLPEDYLALHKEILRRRGIPDPSYGGVEIPLTAWDNEDHVFQVVDRPESFSMHVLSPYVRDKDDTGWDVNDISLVLTVTARGTTVLFTGDSTSAIWQERIIPLTLKTKERADWAEASILVASHHGSFSFFGDSRDAVRDADPFPTNYEALDLISPEHIVISAQTDFPTRDQSGDQPPHYAAWKWYHKWVCDNRNVKASDKEPELFKFTADGAVRLEYANGSWAWVDDWSPDDDGNGHGPKGFERGYGKTQRPPSRYA